MDKLESMVSKGNKISKVYRMDQVFVGYHMEINERSWSAEIVHRTISSNLKLAVAAAEDFCGL